MVRLAHLVPVGLCVNAFALVLFALAVVPGTTDRVLLLAEAAAVLVTAWGLRDWHGIASEGIAATGLVLYALLETLHIGVAATSGLAGAGLASFGLYVAGTFVAAAGAIGWHRSMAESGTAMHVMRAGFGLVALANVAFIALGPVSALAVIVSMLGITGMGLAAWAFAPEPTTPAETTALAAG